MSTIGEHLDAMPEPYRSLALANAGKQKPVEHLRHQAADLWHAVGTAFQWADTPEGVAFWYAVANGESPSFAPPLTARPEPGVYRTRGGWRAVVAINTPNPCGWLVYPDGWLQPCQWHNNGQKKAGQPGSEDLLERTGDLPLSAREVKARKALEWAEAVTAEREADAGCEFPGLLLKELRSALEALPAGKEET